jgi:hypothetical protein
MTYIMREVPCGTAFCIAGWARALDPGITDDACYYGQRLLDLTSNEARRLVVMSFWPDQFKGPDDFSEEASARAIARIEHFIKTEGRE